jgi:hypothetical protein
MLSICLIWATYVARIELKCTQNMMSGNLNERDHFGDLSAYCINSGTSCFNIRYLVILHVVCVYMPTLADRGCHVVSAANPHGR